jgi:hypothetical protein
MITKGDAIRSLRPNAVYSIVGETVNWLDEEQTKPTDEEIVNEIAKLQYEEEVNQYQIERSNAYPSYAEQLDYIYHNGVESWKTDVVDPVKATYPKQEIDEDELSSRQAQALFDHRLKEYGKAVKRLEQYQAAIGQDEITEEVVVGQEIESTDEDGNHTYVDVTETRILTEAILPVDPTIENVVYDESTDTTTIETIENPLITKDNEERAAAQDVINNTEQAVIDHYEANQ